MDKDEHEHGREGDLPEPQVIRSSGHQVITSAPPHPIRSSGHQVITLPRLLRLWRLYAYLDLVWVTRDLKSALLYLGTDAVAVAAAVTAMLLLAERFEGIGHWSKLQVVFMLGYATVVRGLLDVFFNFNVLTISRRVGRGQLDHLLIQPQPLWMALLTEGFAPYSGAAVVAPGLGLMLWAIVRLPVAVTPGWLALLALNMAASGAIIVAYLFLWGSLAFWTPRSAEEISSAAVRLFDQLMSFPLDGLGGGALAGLLTLVPVGFVAWYPCRTLLGVHGARWDAAVTPLAAVLMAALAAGAFLGGLKQYGRTGSQRYLSFGHRR